MTAGRPTIIYTWTPSQYIAGLQPGVDVYWMGMDRILDDSNPASLPGGEKFDQTDADGSGGYARISQSHCPSANSTSNGLCPTGWIAADIRVTANNDFLEANPAVRALLAAVKLSPLGVSAAMAEQFAGASLSRPASQWIADNRRTVDMWLFAARTAS